nr:HEPN domain-containing protein [uncultured Desulfobulbus sp.]
MNKEPTPTLNDLAMKPNVYSWSSKVDFVINNVGGFKDYKESSLCLLWKQPFILTLEKKKIHPHLEESGASGYRLKIDASLTACEAERAGKRLVYALLSVAIFRYWGVTLSWQDTPLPCRVIDRTVSGGMRVQGFASVKNDISLGEFAEKLSHSFSELNEIPYTLLLSMELCASSRFQTDDRTKLILLISALEAIAEQRNISSEVGDLILSLKSLVNDYKFTDESLKNSLIGQIGNLVRESSRRAIKRVLLSADINKEDINFVEEAYGARSKIVHEGHRIPEMSIMNARIDRILQSVYKRYVYGITT